MDAEFVEYLDKKFQDVTRDIQALRVLVDAEVKEIRAELRFLRESVQSLATSVDRFVKLHEQLEMKQVSLRSDIDRIKAVLREKLGVQL